MYKTHYVTKFIYLHFSFVNKIVILYVLQIIYLAIVIMLTVFNKISYIFTCCPYSFPTYFKIVHIRRDVYRVHVCTTSF